MQLILIRIQTSILFQNIINKKCMKNLKETVRKLKSRMSFEDVYMYVYEYLYYEIFLGEGIHYYNFLNVVNIDKLIPLLYEHYFIDRDNIDRFSANVLDKIVRDFVLIRSDENEAYNESNVVILNRYYVKQSRKFNSLIESNPEYTNLIKDITKGLESYLVNTNFMYSLLHPDSILYSFIDKYSYSELIIQMQEYMIDKGIAISLDSYLTSGYFKDKDIVRKYVTEELFSVRLYSETDIPNNIMLVHYAFFDEWDIMRIYNLKQLTDSFIDDFTIGEGYRVFRV